jgi:hypothetical protein
MLVEVGTQSYGASPTKKKNKTQASAPHHSPKGDGGSPKHHDHSKNPKNASSLEHNSKDGLVRTTPSENLERISAHTKV